MTQQELATATVVISALGAVLGLWRHMETRRLEAERPFLERQFELFARVSRAAATCATQNDTASINVSRREFEVLQYGELTLVQGRQVRDAVDAFSAALLSDVPQELMRERAQKVAEACRIELARAWRTRRWKV